MASGRALALPMGANYKQLCAWLENARLAGVNWNSMAQVGAGQVAPIDGSPVDLRADLVWARESTGGPTIDYDCAHLFLLTNGRFTRLGRSRAPIFQEHFCVCLLILAPQAG